MTAIRSLMHPFVACPISSLLKPNVLLDSCSFSICGRRRRLGRRRRADPSVVAVVLASYAFTVVAKAGVAAAPVVAEADAVVPAGRCPSHAMKQVDMERSMVDMHGLPTD